MHEGTHGEPETVEDVEVVGDGRPVTVVLDLPLERTESADQEQHHADAEVREDDAHPDLGRQRFHEREHARLVLCRLLLNNDNINAQQRHNCAARSFPKS